MDELGCDPAPVSRRGRVVVVLVVLLLVAGVTADRWQRDRELDDLLDAVVAAERLVRASQASLASLASYQSALLVRADVPPEARDSAYANLARDAARWSPQLEAARQDVARSGALPWHPDIRAAREAYVRRADTWVGVLTTLAERPDQGLSGQTEVTRTREAAQQALQAAAGGNERLAELGN